jgi:hypothetical protein
MLINHRIVGGGSQFMALCMAVLVTAALPADAVACSGACGLTIFTAGSANACDMVTITLTGATIGSIWGGDIYRYDSNLQAAAVHQGLLANGATGTLYAFWAGTRYAFSPVTRNGMTSSSSATDNYGIILSATATCPTFTATANPITNIVATWSTIWGSGHYTFDSSVNAAIEHYALAAPGETISLVYTHTFAIKHSPFYSSRTGTRTSSMIYSPTEAYALRRDATSFIYKPNVTRVYYDGTYSGSCYGWSYYRADGTLNAAVAHSGLWPVDQEGYVNVHYVGNRWLFYSATQNGIACASSLRGSPEPAIEISLSETRHGAAARQHHRGLPQQRRPRHVDVRLRHDVLHFRQ